MTEAEVQIRGDDAATLLRIARQVAVAEFGAAAVAEIPRLVTDVALVMALRAPVPGAR